MWCLALRKVQHLVPFFGDSHLQSCTTLGTVTGKSNNRLQPEWTFSAVLLHPASLPCQLLDAIPWGVRLLAPEKLTELLCLWVRVIAQQTWPDNKRITSL